MDPENNIIPQPESLSRMKVKFVDPSSGIDDIQPNYSVEEIARYNVQGIRVPAETKGIVIIYYSDGSRRKAFVK